jgi:hypothetical protein
MVPRRLCCPNAVVLSVTTSAIVDNTCDGHSRLIAFSPH